MYSSLFHHSYGFAGRRSGFSFIELMASLSILVIGAMAIMATFVSTTRLADETKELAVFTTSCRNMRETLKAESFSTLTTNWGPSTSRPSLYCNTSGTVSTTTSTGAPVNSTIEFFSREDSIPSTFADLDGGFDLNKDGTVNSTAVTNYKILPGRLVTTLNCKGGARTVTLDFIMTPSVSW